MLDQDGDIIISEGLVLPDAAIWKKFVDMDLIPIGAVQCTFRGSI